MKLYLGFAAYHATRPCDDRARAERIAKLRSGLEMVMAPIVAPPAPDEKPIVFPP